MKWRQWHCTLPVMWLISGMAVEAAPDVSVPTVAIGSMVKIDAVAPRRHVGMVESIRHVDIMPRVTGNLNKVAFREGELIQAGELLYELEDTTYRAAVERLKAQKEMLEATLRYALTEYNRSSTLLEHKAVAVSTHDKAVLDIASAKANLKELDAALLDAENTLSYTRIHAPISGRIGKSNFTPGNLITAQGGKLTDIAMIAPIYVRFSLSERIFRSDFNGSEGIRERAVVRIQLADNTIYPESAHITLIDNKIDGSTNTITCWATFANQDYRLIPGSFVTVLLSPVENASPWGILPSALVAENDGYVVYVLNAGNQVEKRAVTPGRMAGEYRQILTGLDGSERVVVDGTHKLTVGMTVIPATLNASQSE